MGDNEQRSQPLEGPAPEQPAPEEASPPTPLGGIALPTGGLGQMLGEDFDLAQAVGGVRGVVEAFAPGTVFLVAYLISDQLLAPLVTAGAAALLATLVRLVQGTPVTQAVAGLLGVGIGVVLALRSGQAQDYFLWGLMTNTAYVVVIVPLLLVRLPLVGVVVCLLLGRDFGWRKDPARRSERQAYYYATFAWLGLFVARLLVQVPLYYAGQVAALGIARLVMGVPLWAGVMWLTWLLVRAIIWPKREAK